MKSQPILLGIIAPSLPIRLGLRSLAQEIENIEVQFEAASLEELFESDHIDLAKFDVLLVMDDNLDLEKFIEFAEGNTAILILTDQPNNAYLLAEVNVPWGILPIDSEVNELSIAISALHAGLWVGDPRLLREILTQRQFDQTNEPTALYQRPISSSDVDPLTKRELEVLEALSQGQANKQIALALGISENTIKFHISSIYTKLGVTNRTEAVRYGFQIGLITL